MGSSRRDLRGFPDEARSAAGCELRRVQRGLEPTDWKPMPTVGPGVREIRVRTGREHRVFYVASFREAIYVIHAFEKKTQTTPWRDLTIARERYRAVVTKRGEDDGEED